MKVGDYIRDKRGMIAKIKKFWIYHNVTFIITDKDTISESMVVKSSPNIIDLIEYGDIVKYKIDDEEFISEVWGEKNDYFVQNFDVPIDLRDLNIVSIVTKEQFESMKYEVNK